jgi:small neutral amino acid transporter SnatA (MarC family)
VGGRVALFATAVAGVGVLVFGIAAPPERCPEVTVDDLRTAATATVDWFVRNQGADGRWLYEYDREGGPVDTGYNEVRHAGVISALYQAASAGIPGALESADRGLAWAMGNLVDGDGWVAMKGSEGVPVGASALLLAGLLERRAATGDGQHDELARSLGRFLASQTEPSGALLGYYDTATGQPVPATYSKYYTGEAYWALARLHTAFPDEGWGEVADSIGHYLATARDDAEDLFPPLPDHWAGYGLAVTSAFPERASDRPLTEAELSYARRQAGLFGAQVRFISQRMGPWGAVVRTRHAPRGGGYGVVGEGLTGLWIAAQADVRLADLRGTLVDRTTCVAGLAIAAQDDEADAAGYGEPAKVQGAWFLDDVTRMDDMQHALSALLRTIPVLEAGESAGGSGSDRHAPSAWLWFVILVVALNPLRAALGVPRSGRTKGEVAGIAAVGGVGGAFVVVVVALASGWLLDAVDVSDSSLRIAAGVVGVLGAAVDLFRPAPKPEPALPGWRAALVPVAVPLVIRPALLVLAMSAVADHGAWLVVGGLAVAVGTLVALAGLAPADGVAGRVLCWSARLAAIVLAAASVVLVVNGILDV